MKNLDNKAEIDETLSKKDVEAPYPINELFASFMKYSPIHFFIKEVTLDRSRVIQASENFQQMIAIPGSAMVGKTMEELFPAELAAKITEDDRNVISNGLALQLTEELDGRTYETTKFPFVLGNNTLLAGYMVDITERKNAQEKIREINERLQLALNSAKIGVWDWDIQKDHMTWDDRMLEFYGVTRAQFSGEVVAREKGLHPDDLVRVNAELQAALCGERDFDTEFRILHHDGKVIYLKANGSVFRDKEGKPLRMIGVNMDISEKKNAEEKDRAQVKKLQVYYDGAFGREERILDLKKEVEQLKKELGRPS